MELVLTIQKAWYRCRCTVADFHLEYDLRFMSTLGHLLQGRAGVKEVHGARQMLEINLGKVVRSAWTGNVSGSERMSETEKGTENEKEIETGSVDVRKKSFVPEKMRSAGRMKIGPGMTVLANGSGSVTGALCVLASLAPCLVGLLSNSVYVMICGMAPKDLPKDLPKDIDSACFDTGTAGMIAEIGPGKGTVGVIADGTGRGSAIEAVAEIARKLGIQMEADVNEKQERIVGPSLEPYALRRMQKEEGGKMRKNEKLGATRWVEAEVEAGA